MGLEAKKHPAETRWPAATRVPGRSAERARKQREKQEIDGDSWRPGAKIEEKARVQRVFPHFLCITSPSRMGVIF
jgi:hypothetical protein